MSDPKPKLSPITRRRGVAGQVSYTLTVTYEGEDPSMITFVGDVSGEGPVVMVTTGNPKGVFVTNPGRLGKFGENWVLAFFATD